MAMEVGSRCILHYNVTAHPTAEWTIQQLREFLPFEYPFRFLIHDRDTKFTPGFDQALVTFGLRGLKTPVRTPTRIRIANGSSVPCAASAWIS